jgi:hypothetical protein
VGRHWAPKTMWRQPGQVGAELVLLEPVTWNPGLPILICLDLPRLAQLSCQWLGIQDCPFWFAQTCLDLPSSAGLKSRIARFDTPTHTHTHPSISSSPIHLEPHRKKQQQPARSGGPRFAKKQTTTTNLSWRLPQLPRESPPWCVFECCRIQRSLL